MCPCFRYTCPPSNLYKQTTGGQDTPARRPPILWLTRGDSYPMPAHISQRLPCSPLRRVDFCPDALMSNDDNLCRVRHSPLCPPFDPFRTQQFVLCAAVSTRPLRLLDPRPWPSPFAPFLAHGIGRAFTSRFAWQAFFDAGPPDSSTPAQRLDTNGDTP